MNGLVVATCLQTAAMADDWPEFRGPNNSGVSAESQAPSQWSDMRNLAWSHKIPGYGWSSPIVVGDKIILTTAITDKQEAPKGLSLGNFGFVKLPGAVYRWEVHCLDRNTGKTLWSQIALEGKPRIAATPGNTYASETPISDGVCVYAYFGMHGVYCYNLDGKKLWQRDLGVYKMLMNWGTGSSPALEGDRLFILCDNEEKSFLVAMDKKTGKDLWRVSRDEKSSWTTPFVWRNRVRVEIVAAGAGAIRSYDPADGGILWQLKRPAASAMSYVNATPVGSESMLYVAGGSKPGSSPLWAVKAGASGDISPKAGEASNAGIAWSSPRACPPMASPLLYKDYLYILMQNGILMCLDATNGQELYKERLKGAKSLTSSPWAYDGKLYCLDEDGQTFVVEAGSKFELVDKNQIRDRFWATPALSRDAVYLRGVDRLWCIRKQTGGPNASPP